MSLHVPAGACILVASVSSNSIRVLKVYLSIVVRTNIYKYICDLSSKKGPYVIFTSLQENMKMYMFHLYKPIIKQNFIWP